jgi:hypothetical protein
MEWVLLIAKLPAKAPLAAGILLLDRAADELHIQLLPDLSEAPEDAAEVWRELQQDLMERSRQQGGSRILDWLETMASNFIQLSGRNHVETDMAEKTLGLLYRKHVTGDLEDRRQLGRLGPRRGAGH